VRIQGVVDNNVWPPRMGHTVRVWNLYKELGRISGVESVRVIAALKSRERGAGRERRDGVDIARIRPGHPSVFAWLERAGLAPLSLTAEGYRRWPGPFARAWDDGADVFQVDSLPLSPLLSHAPRGTLKVYGSQNVEMEWLERVGSDVARRPRWARFLARLEAEALALADLVVAVSADDKAAFVSRYGVDPAKVVVVDNGFDATGLRPPTEAEQAGARGALNLSPGERGLVFVGTDFEHNRRAVDALFTHVVPRLGEIGARLWIVGDVSGAFRGRAAREGQGRVRAVPAQADLTPWLWGCDIGLNPVTTGAGSNVKLPTYLACGLDVVTTPFGARGFERLGPFVVRVPLEGFAAALAGPLPARSGRDTALASYAWGTAARTLLDAYAVRLGAGSAR